MTSRSDVGTVAGMTAAVLGALAMAAALHQSGDSPEEVRVLGELLVLLPLVYLVVAKLRWRRWTWLALLLLVVPVAVLKQVGVVSPAVVLVAVAAGFLLWGLLDRQLRTDADLRLQALGMAGFGALALAGYLAGADVARYVVGAAWVLHGVWDVVHLVRDRVVSRSYALWCGILDILVGAGLWIGW